MTVSYPLNPGSATRSLTPCGPKPIDPCDPAWKPRTGVPVFGQFARDSLANNQPTWSASYHRTTARDVGHILTPLLANVPIDQIGRADVLQVRRTLAARPGREGTATLSLRRLNALIATTRQILAKGALQYGHANPAADLQSVPELQPEIHPFSREAVHRLLTHAPVWWQSYLAIRVLTELRTEEINGLRWPDVDAESYCLRIRVSRVMGRMAGTKTRASRRDVPLSTDVDKALDLQRGQSIRNDRVFTTPRGCSIDPANFTTRFWLPLLASPGLAPRRSYQTRHTAATLMLAAGENPEWIAHVLGHTNTRLLFSTYSRYVPALTRRDGSVYAHLMKEISP